MNMIQLWAFSRLQLSLFHLSFHILRSELFMIKETLNASLLVILYKQFSWLAVSPVGNCQNKCYTYIIFEKIYCFKETCQHFRLSIYLLVKNVFINIVMTGTGSICILFHIFSLQNLSQIFSLAYFPNTTVFCKYNDVPDQYSFSLGLEWLVC
jgi:hypothetical protein